jgi:signal transduction histidine kinase/ligand-binding sensor domain-containing protein
MSGGKGCRVHLVLALLLASRCLFAQGTRQQERVRLPIEDGTDLVCVPVPFAGGSSHATVTQIVRGQSEFLWFGTKDGLKRYDGYRFLEFRPESGNPHSLSGLDVESVFNESGRLWVASDLSVDRYDRATETFTRYPPQPHVLEGPIHDINQDRAGMIWLATAHGLTRIDPATGSMSRFLDPMTAVLRSTFEQKDGTFWVAGKESVDVFDRSTGETRQHIPLRDPAAPGGRTANPSVHLFEDHAGVVWVESDRDGLARVDRPNNRLIYYTLRTTKDPPFEPGVRAIHEDEEGELWVGTNGAGLFKLDRDRKKWIRYRNDPDDPESLGGDRILALFEDHEGAMWVGLDGGGLERFPIRSPFHRYRRPPGSLRTSITDYVSSAYQDVQGNIWLGGKGIVTRIDAKTGQFLSYRLGAAPGEPSDGDVQAIVEDSGGKLWFGVWGGGLRRFDPRTEQWKSYRHRPDDASSLGQDSVFALLIDHRGRLWVGTEDGLNAFDAKTERFRVYRKPELGPNRERALAEDSHGTIWMATLFTGVHRFDPDTGQFTIYRHSEAEGSLSNDAVAAITVDRSGAVWAGTANGLNRLDTATGKFAAYYERDGLAGNSVLGVQEDQRGDLWAATNNGLSRFDHGAGAFQNYYVSDGVPADLTSLWKSRTAEMLLGSYSGLIHFLPDRVALTQYAPPVVFTSFRLNDMPAPIGGDSPLKQSITLTQSLTLSHQQRIFAFEFAALSFAGPSRTRYRYRLEGLEAGWREVDASQRSARYTTLRPGKYVFRVESRTNRGAWNENGAAVRIEILPPWWDTWPFRAFCAVAFCMALWAAYRLRVAQMAGRLNLRFEERLAERTRIAGELHDTLLQGFLSASMQLDVAADQVAPDSPVGRQLNHILELMSQVSAEGRNAVQGLRMPEGNSMRLEEAFAGIEREIAGTGTGTSSKLRVVLNGWSRPLHPVFRDEVYRIGREAIVNAFRHSGAQMIDVEIEYARSEFRLVVRDNGRGIDPEVLREGREGHWGMRGMRERSERIGAKLRVWSRPEMGTRVEMSALGKIAFRPPPRRNPRPWVMSLRRGIGRVMGRPPDWPHVNNQKVVGKDSEP